MRSSPFRTAPSPPHSISMPSAAQGASRGGLGLRGAISQTSCNWAFRGQARDRAEQTQTHGLRLATGQNLHLRQIRDRLTRATHPTAIAPGVSALAGHPPKDAGRRPSIPELERKTGAIGPSRFRFGAELAVRRETGSAFLQKGSCRSHLRGRGMLLPALSAFQTIWLRSGGCCSQLRSGQWRSSAFQLYLDLGHEEANEMRGTDHTMQAFGLESRACSRFGWGFFLFASSGASFLLF